MSTENALPDLHSLEQKREFLRKLDAAIYSGVYTLTHEGKTVTYRTLADMMRVRKILMNDVGMPVANPANLRKSRVFRGVVRMR